MLKRLLTLFALPYLPVLALSVYYAFDNLYYAVTTLFVGIFFVPWGMAWGVVGLLNHFGDCITSIDTVNHWVVTPAYFAFAIVAVAYLMSKTMKGRMGLLAIYTGMCVLAVYGFCFYVFNACD